MSEIFAAPESIFLENAEGYSWPGKPHIMVGDHLEVIKNDGAWLRMRVISGPREGNATWFRKRDGFQRVAPLMALGGASE